MRVEPLPWLTASGGLPLGAWWRTLAACISKPSTIAARCEVIADIGPPVRFLGLTLGIIYGITTTLGLLFTVLMLGAFSGLTPAAATQAPIISMVLLGVLQSVMSLLLLIGGLAATAALVPRFAGGENVDFRRVFSVLSFASASLVFTLVPICGGLAGPIVWIVMCSQAIARAVPKEKATAAVVVTVACLFGVMLLQCGMGLAAQFFLV
jgi:hypothetical protein